jgi:hypothetical protein
LDIPHLIDHHTLLPYYARFASPAAVAATRSSMSDGNGSRIGFLLGLSAMGPKPPLWFRSCAHCAADDVQTNGASIWRRVHQAPGVFVCPLHAITLTEHPLRARSQTHFIPQDLAPPGRPSSTPLFPAMALRLARSSQWLIANPGMGIGAAGVRMRIREILVSQGWGDSLDCIRRTDLTRAFVAHVGAKSLADLGLTAKGGGVGDWFHRLWEGKHAVHPLCILLALDFLKTTPEEFFSGNSESRPKAIHDRVPHTFASTPCANPTCNAHETAWSRMLCDSANDSGCAVHCTICDFGYVWRRRFPNTLRVQHSCVPWDRFVRTLCGSANSLKCICKQVFLSSENFLKEAGRIGVWRDCWHDQRARSLKRHRENFRLLKAENPDLGRSELAYISPGTYSFLSKHDATWFDVNLPGRPKRRPACDLAALDKEFASAIPAAVARIRNRQIPPVRVTLTAIGRELRLTRLKSDFCARRQLMPMTSAVISLMTEDALAFTHRRLDWTARRSRERGQPVTRGRLKDTISGNLRHEPSVRQHVDDLLEKTRHE